MMMDHMSHVYQTSTGRVYTVMDVDVFVIYC